MQKMSERSRRAYPVPVYGITDTWVLFSNFCPGVFSGGSVISTLNGSSPLTAAVKICNIGDFGGTGTERTDGSAVSRMPVPAGSYEADHHSKESALQNLQRTFFAVGLLEANF